MFSTGYLINDKLSDATYFESDAKKMKTLHLNNHISFSFNLKTSFFYWK